MEGPQSPHRPSPCCGLVATHWLRLPAAPSCLASSTSKDGAAAASLGSLRQCQPLPDCWDGCREAAGLAGCQGSRQAGWLHAMRWGRSFPHCLPLAPLYGAHSSPACLGVRTLELWRETAIACICEFLQRKDKVRAAVCTHCGNSPGSSPGRYPAGIAPRPTMLGVLLAVDLTFMPALVPSVTTRMCKRKSNS